MSPTDRLRNIVRSRCVTVFAFRATLSESRKPALIDRRSGPYARAPGLTRGLSGDVVYAAWKPAWVSTALPLSDLT
jgi:hypothetical protein